MLLKINTEVEGDLLRLTLSGEFDLAAVPRFRKAVEQSETPWERAEIDMSDLAFMDSSGLQALVQLNNAAHEQGLEVTLLRPSHPVRRLLELTGLESQFAVRH
jgi:anti-sigma B factor antagonist